MRKLVVLIVSAALFAGCSSGVEFKDAMVLYRGPIKGVPKPVFMGFVTEGHPFYMTAGGNVREELPGAKPVDRETAAECLEAFADQGYPEEWTKAGSLAAALSAEPSSHVIVCDLDGDLRFLSRPKSVADAAGRNSMSMFSACKTALIECSISRAGYRVISNKEGEDLLEREREQLLRDRDAKGAQEGR